MAGILMLLLWVALIPLLIGIGFSGFLPERRRTLAVVYISGVLIQFAVFFIVFLPCMLLFLWDPFYVASRIFSVAAYLLASVGFVMLLRRLSGKDVSANCLKDMQNRANAMPILFRIFPGERNKRAEAVADSVQAGTGRSRFRGKEAYIYWGLFAVLLGFQLYMACTRAFFDGDDSYYVVQSLIAQKMGRLYTIIPYTGMTTRLDIRHALALLPAWEAFLAEEAGIHATIMVHTYLPFFYLPFGYLVFSQIARSLFGKRREAVPVFLCLLCFIQIFGNVSIYTSETFFITRTAQGKAVMAAIVIPLVLWIFMWLFEEKDETGHEASPAASRTKYAPWILLMLINVMAGMCTSIGVLLTAGLIALLSLLLVFHTRNARLLVPAVLACVPNVLYTGLYLFIK